MGLAETLDATLGLGLDAEGVWYRTDIARGLELREGKPNVDKEKRVIHGFSVIEKGEAKGHGVLIDEKFMDSVVLQGNESKHGVKMRFDHPNASSTSMGTALGRAMNFRRDGNAVRADAFLLESATRSPQGDLPSYVMELAQEDPSMFGASIAFKSAEPEYQLDDDGKPDKTKPPFVRLKKLLAADIVDDPAATSGMFNSTESLAAKLTGFLNRWAANDLVPAIVAHITQQAPIQEVAMAEGTVIPAQPTEDLFKKGMEAERARVAGIQNAAKQFKDMPASVVEELINMGATVDEAMHTFKKRRLQELEQVAPQTAGGGQDSSAPKKVDLSALSGEELFTAEFNDDPKLRNEFQTLPVYIAYRKAESNGQITFSERPKAGTVAA